MYWLRNTLLSLAILLAAFTQAFATDKPDRITVINSSSWPPFSFVNEKGQPKGILVDLWQEIGHQQGIEVEFVTQSWKDTLTAVKQGDADIHTGLFSSVEREAYLDFSVPIRIPFATRLFVSNKLQVKGMSDIGNLAIGVTLGGFAEGFIHNDYPHINLQTFSNSKQVVEAAIAGDILAFVLDYPAAMYYLHKYNAPTMFRVSETLYSKKLRAAVVKGNQEMLNFVNLAFQDLPTEEFDRITTKWLQSETRTPSWLIPTFSSVLIFLLICFSLFYIIALKRQVAARTEDLQRLSETDSLTGILNRKKIEEKFADELIRYKRYNRPFSIMLIDIDKFKEVNDTFGHPVGDEVLIALAKLLNNSVRQADSVARWGGEEFLLICPNTCIKEATILAEKLRKQIEEYDFPEIKHCTASFGVAEASQQDETKDIFMRADKALYRSKTEGRNRISC